MKPWFGSTALVLGLGLGLHLSGSAAAQQVQYACDQNDDGSVDAIESRLCTIVSSTRSRPARRRSLKSSCSPR